MAASRQSRMLEAGAPAPDFQLHDLEGHPRSLRELTAAGPLVVAFYKTTCPVCQLTLPFLDRIHRGQAEPAVAIYAVSQDDAATSAEFNQEFGVSLPTLLDRAESDYPASNAYRISHVPSVFLVEPDGKISWTMEGFDKKALEALGARAGVEVFQATDDVPAFKAG
jgi:peroxiredoxin